MFIASGNSELSPSLQQGSTRIFANLGLLWPDNDPAGVELKLLKKLFYCKVYRGLWLLLTNQPARYLNQQLRSEGFFLSSAVHWCHVGCLTKVLKVSCVAKSWMFFFVHCACLHNCIFSWIYSFCQSCTFKRQFSWFRKWISRFNGLHWSYFKQLIFIIPGAIWDEQGKWGWSDLITFHCSLQWLTI